MESLRREEFSFVDESSRRGALFSVLFPKERTSPINNELFSWMLRGVAKFSVRISSEGYK
jgi:hypothetical protein